MNDDVLIKDILSGNYAGIPDGHNIQMLYPLSWFISLLYKIIPSINWFGIFLLSCFILSFYLVLERTLSALNDKWEKVVCTLLIIAMYAGLLLWEMVYVQYTVVCGLLAATATVNLLFTPKGLSTKEFLKKNIITILLVTIAFNLRTEMLLLMCPFLGMAGILKMATEFPVTWKTILSKYGTLLFCMVVFIGLSFGLHKVAYASEDWKEFQRFFDSRTEVYDFTWYPKYEENETFYEESDISYAQYQLIDNYNFGLDERINADTLDKIAQFQSTQKKASESVTANLKRVLWQYRYQLTHFDLNATHELRTMPYNMIVLLLYVTIILCAILKKDKSYLWKVPVLLVFRSVSWGYILWRGRVVARLIHPMYFIEILILLTLLLWAWNENERKQLNCQQKAKYLLISCVSLMGILLLITIPASVKVANDEQVRREEVNATDEALKEYCKAHPDNFYYVDVYSTVVFSEGLLDKNKGKGTNYDILGGWFSKSPLYYEKAKNYDITDIKLDFLTKENLYFIAEATSDVSWLVTFYEDLGYDVAIEEKDKIDSNTDLLVYRINMLK